MRALSVLLVVLAGAFFAVLAGATAISKATSKATSKVSGGSVGVSRSQTSSFGASVTRSRTGDFSWNGGRISADTKLLISSPGNLTLDSLFTFAPETGLVAGTSLWHGPGVSNHTKGGTISISGRDVNTSVRSEINTNGGTISIGGSDDSRNNSGDHLVMEGGRDPDTGGGTIKLVFSPRENVGEFRFIPGNNYPLTGSGTIAVMSPVPEPSSYVSMLTGLVTLVWFLRAKKRRVA